MPNGIAWPGNLFMSDSTRNEYPLDAIRRAPSVYSLWKVARERGESPGEREDIYRELLEEFGHRNVGSARW